VAEAETAKSETDYAATPIPPPTEDIAYTTARPVSQAQQAKASKRTAELKEVPPLDKINYYVGQIRNEDGQPMDAVKLIAL